VLLFDGDPRALDAPEPGIDATLREQIARENADVG
jgi:hypothetical protein